MAVDDDFTLSVEITAELERFEQNMKRAGRVVETSVSGMDKATQRAGRQFAQLEGRMDPAARAANRLARDSEKVSRALEKGAVSSDRAAKLQKRLNDQYEMSIARVRQLDTATTTATTRLNATASPLRAATGSTGRFGSAMQNAGFQVADFATQVGAGTSAMRAMSMQLPQLIGGFGPWAAAISAVVATAGALYVALGDVNDEASDTSGKMKTYKDSLEEVERITKRLNKESLTRAQRLRFEGVAALEGAQAELQAAQEKLQAIAIRRQQDGLGEFLERDLEVSKQTKAAEELADAYERLEGLRERLNKAIGEATTETNDNTAATNDNAGAVRDLDTSHQSVLGSLRDQIELQRLDARERAITAAVMQAQNSAMREGNLLLPEQVAKVRELAGELFDLRNNTTEAADAGADFERSLNDQQRTMERYQSEVERTGEQVGEAFTDGILNSMDEGFAGITDLFERSVQALATTALAPATVVEGPRP